MRRLRRVGEGCETDWLRTVRGVRELVRLVKEDEWDWLPRGRLSLLRYVLSAAIEKRGEDRKWQDYVASVEAFRLRERGAA
jgi:hypothetical protein